MVGGECPNCGQFINASRSRLVRDACGHTKCRMCLVYEEEGCKACQNEHRIQMIGNFDYPIPTSGFSEKNVSGSSSGNELVMLQPLELVTNKSQNHVKIIFKQQESNHFEASDSCDERIDWDQEGRTEANDTSVKNNDELIRAENESTSTSRDQTLVETLDAQDGRGFCGPESEMEFSESVYSSQPEIPRMEPSAVISNIRSHLEESREARNEFENKAQSGEQNCATEDDPKNCESSESKKSHISVIAKSPEKYRCNACNKEFKSKTAQRYHSPCVAAKPYQCEICNKSFVKKSHYQYHQRMHTGYKPFKCDKCDKAFPQRNKLNRHMYSHQNDKKYNCPVCGKGYSSRDVLKSHVNMHEGLTPYTCEVCNKQFREASNLTRHRHTHSTERPYTCEQCGKSFKEKCMLVRHKRTHGKDRPFSCSNCVRVFLSKSELSRHLAVHSDEKPFPCHYCSTVFRRRDNLNRHMRHHHSDNSAAGNAESTDARSAKSKSVRTSKSKPRTKTKSATSLPPKSPAKIAVVYVNSHEQLSGQLNPKVSVVPPIRTFNESSNAVPVINGPISIRRPEPKTNSPKKCFTHTEPIPLAEAAVINRRIEQKLYAKSNTSQDYFFLHNFHGHGRTDQQHLAHKMIPARLDVSVKSPLSSQKIASPERANFDACTSETPSTPQSEENSTAAKMLVMDDKLISTTVTTTNENRAWVQIEGSAMTAKSDAGPKIASTSIGSDSHGNVTMNLPRHTVPKKRAIENLRANPSGIEPCDRFAIPVQPMGKEPERANCVPTITKAGGQMEMLNHDGKVTGTGRVEKFPPQNVSDIHWRRRTSEILKPWID